MGSLCLERVQFKFASIIGELCNEPDVLSQFAVWLDMRLAEYKLKGNISLDCSGEEPDPIWLKGLKKDHKTRKRSAMNQSNSDNQNQSLFSQSFKTEGDNQSTFLEETANSELISRLSPDVTVINDDEQSQVYAVSFHENKLEASNSRRKSLFKAESGNNWSPSPTKHRRVSAAENSPSNQSLMSVLSVYQGNPQESGTKGDNLLDPSATPLAQPGTSHSTHDNERTDYQQHEQGDSSDLIGEKAGTLTLMDDSDMVDLPSETAYRSRQVFQEFWGVERPCSSSIANRRLSIVNLANLSKQSVRNMVAAAGTFERWISENNQDLRHVLQIPPQELNSLLVDFFLSVKRPGGGDYTLLSLQTLRSHLDRYLRECQYPESMMRSPTFSQSRKAFQSRRQQFSQLRVQEALAALNSPSNDQGPAAQNPDEH